MSLSQAVGQSEAISTGFSSAIVKRFSFRDYNVVTGHLSAFYASPWYNLDLGVHVGRYLAKDRGFTFDPGGLSIMGFLLELSSQERTFQPEILVRVVLTKVCF